MCNMVCGVQGWEHYQSILEPEFDRDKAFSQHIAHIAPIHHALLLLQTEPDNLPCNSRRHGCSLVTKKNRIVLGPLWGQKQITLLFSQRENNYFASHKPTKTPSYFSSEDEAQCSCRAAQRASKTESAKVFHDCLRQREPCEGSPHSGAVQSRLGTNAFGHLGMASHHGHHLAHKLSDCHCKCALEEPYCYTPSDFRTAFWGKYLRLEIIEQVHPKTQGIISENLTTPLHWFSSWITVSSEH